MRRLLPLLAVLAATAGTVSARDVHHPLVVELAAATQVLPAPGDLAGFGAISAGWTTGPRSLFLGLHFGPEPLLSLQLRQSVITFGSRSATWVSGRVALDGHLGEPELGDVYAGAAIGSELRISGRLALVAQLEAWYRIVGISAEPWFVLAPVGLQVRPLRAVR